MIKCQKILEVIKIGLEKIRATLELKNFAKKIYDEVKSFEESLSEDYFVVVEINNKKIFLEEITNWSDTLLIFSGKDLKSNPVKIFMTYYDLNLVLSSEKIPNESEQKSRMSIGFKNEN